MEAATGTSGHDAAQRTQMRATAGPPGCQQHLLDGVDGGHGHVELLGQPAEAVPRRRPIAVQLRRGRRLTCTAHARLRLRAGSDAQPGNGHAATQHGWKWRLGWGQLRCQEPCTVAVLLAAASWNLADVRMHMILPSRPPFHHIVVFDGQ